MYPVIRKPLTAAQLHQLLTVAHYGSESPPPEWKGFPQSPPLSMLSGLGHGHSHPRFPNNGLEESASLSKGMPLS